jgi:hypothetical protein
LSEEATFWFFIACIAVGAILIFNWLVPGIKIAAVGLIPFVVGIVAVHLLHRKRLSQERSEKNSDL